MRPNNERQLVQEHVGDGIVLLKLNRPHICNALSFSMKRDLAAVFDELGSSQDVRCIILTGNERVFSSGADLNEYENAVPSEIIEHELFRLWQAIARCPKPVIAAVRGHALGGGCELAMHADIIVAGESARFGLPEVRMGLIPGGGGTQRLTRAVGKFAAMHMLMTGEVVEGRRAFEIGLASMVTPDSEVVGKSIELAKRIASMPEHCVRFIKELVLESMNVPLESGIRQEHYAFQTCFSFAEKQNRIGEFLQTKTRTQNTGNHMEKKDYT